MSEIARLCEGLAAVAWPAVAIVLIASFRPAVRALIESARSRKFTVKLGGQEITFEEASSQQRNAVADLRSQVIELRRQVERRSDPCQNMAYSGSEPVVSGAVLWVDDRPRNNSYFVQEIMDKGGTVDIAVSTAEGLRFLDSGSYDVVITDMGRNEDGVYIKEAGLEIVEAARKRDDQVPVIIFSSSRAARECRDEALGRGASLITSSPTEMFEALWRYLDARSRGGRGELIAVEPGRDG